jgi:hypothetical protein
MTGWRKVVTMSGDWMLVLLMTVPALIFAGVRYYFVKRWFGKSKAAVTAGVIMVSLIFGIYKRKEAMRTIQAENPQAFRYSSSPLVRRLFTPSAAPVTITDNATDEEVFSYYRNDGAARLTALERPSVGEWLATLVVNAGEPYNPKLQGMFEKPFNDDARVLPMTRVFRAWNGDLRVEDVQTGQTLFSYPEDSKLKPVSISKLASSAGIYEWKVLFTNGSGLLSQQ